MALDLLAIISAAGTGAVTGYLTNNLALKMIFKKYGPLGGVVIKTKEEFIESISELVERDLINHQTLETEFSRKEFKDSFSKTVADFLNIYLINRSNQVNLANIPAWKENYALVASFFGSSSVNILEKSTEKLENEKLEKLISKSELEKLLQKTYQKSLNKAEEIGSLEKMSSAIYGELKDQRIEKLLSKELQSKLKNFLKEIILYFEANYQKLESENKAEFKEKIKNIFNLSSLSENIIKEIKNIRIDDLFKNDEELKKLKGEKLLQNTIAELLMNLKLELNNSTLKIKDLLSPDLEQAFIKELAESISNSEKEIMSFLAAEEDELNNLILKSIEAEIEASGGLKALSRQGIYSKYKEKIEEYDLPVDYIKKAISKKINSDSEQLAESFLKKIKEVELKKIVKDLEFKKQAELIGEMIWNLYQQNKDKKIFELFTGDLFEKQNFEAKLIDILFSLFHKVSSSEESIETIIDYGLGFKFKDLIKEKDLILKVKQNSEGIYKFLAENDFLTAELADYLNSNFFKLVNSQLKDNQNELKNEVGIYFESLENKFAETKLKDYYQLLGEEENVLKLTDSITSFFYNNLPKLIDGRVAQAASENLHQLSDQEVQQAIEDFMGKELKPITYLGALLGAGAGLAFTLTGAESALFSSAPIWLNYTGAALLYGAVGWLTNVLAIWMIFHPYQEKKIAGLKIPLTPGVVAKNRDRFADSMGKFVEKELLKADSAAKIIEKNRVKIKNRVLSYFEDDDYQQFFTLIKDNNQLLAAKLIEKLNELLVNADKKEIKDFLLSFNKKINQYFEKTAAEFDLNKNIDNYLNDNNLDLEKLKKSVTSKLDLKKITSAAAGKYEVNLNSEQLKKILENPEIYSFFKFIIPNLIGSETNLNFKEKIIENLEKNADYYLERGLNNFYDQQQRIAQLINFKKDELIEAEKKKDGGFFKNTLIASAIYMADLDEFVDSVTSRVFKELKENYIPKKEDKIKTLYFDYLTTLKNKDLFENSSFNFKQLLENFFLSEEASNIIGKLLYLSEDKISLFLDKTVKGGDKKLLNFELEVETDNINYIINQHLTLEQKLKLLLKLKAIFSDQVIISELKKLNSNLDFKVINTELQSLIAAVELFDIDSLDQEIFDQLAANLNKLIREKEFKDFLVKETALEIEAVTADLETDFNRTSLEYLLELFVESGIDSFKSNSEALLKSLELKELTAEEVRKMNPAEIEEIFDSFAGRYFNQLKNYGWFGGIFGLLQLLIRSLI